MILCVIGFRKTMSRYLRSLIILLIEVSARQVLSDTDSDCDHGDRSKSYLDAAVVMISKAIDNYPVCPDISLNSARPVDCEEILSRGHNISGVYTIWPWSRVNRGNSLDVYCDMDTDGGGWTILQRRGNFSRPIDYFYKDWDSYKKGFGNVEKDFWLGNDNIFALTNQKLCSIRFDLKSMDGEKRYALYDSFWIDDEINNYTLHIKDYSGDAGDSMTEKHDNQKFSTKDRDNDNHKENCAQHYKGAWWYNACHDSNLNALNLRGPHESHANGVNWKSWKGHKESLDTTEMKIRSKIFRRESFRRMTPKN